MSTSAPVVKTHDIPIVEPKKEPLRLPQAPEPTPIWIPGVKAPEKTPKRARRTLER